MVCEIFSFCKSWSWTVWKFIVKNSFNVYVVIWDAFGVKAVELCGYSRFRFKFPVAVCLRIDRFRKVVESVWKIIRPIQIVRPVEIDWIKTVNESALLSALRASGYITQRNGGRPDVLFFLLFHRRQDRTGLFRPIKIRLIKNPSSISTKFPCHKHFKWYKT